MNTNVHTVDNELKGIHSDFFAIQKTIHESLWLICNNVKKEIESQDYGACTFTINNQHIAFRVGKITSTKVG